MKQLMFGILACSMAFVIGCGGSTTSGTSSGGGGSNADKIVGTWKIVKIDGEGPPKDAPEVTIEFTKDNKAKRMRGGKGTDEMSYKIDGDKIIMTKPNESGDKPATIKTLTADTLIIVDERGEGKDKKSTELELKKQK